MSLGLNLDRGRTQALYQQIAEQIERQICEGRLPVGTRLPTVRELATGLGVTRLTAHNAYTELKARGWVESAVGRGTFVTEAAPVRRLATLEATELSTDAVMEDMGRIPQVVGLKSLAYAHPDPRLFPTQSFADSLANVQPNLSELLSYSSTQGDAGLRVELAKWLHDQQIDATPDEILITVGATQGLTIAAMALARPHDTVIVERPTYVGNLHTLRTLGLEVLSAPLDEHGVNLEALERLFLHRRPRFFFTIPSFHNPTGIAMAEGRRHDLLALAKRYGVLIIEDDTYGLLAYDGPAPLPLKAFDEDGIVIYISSVSKTMMPGIRIGYTIAPSDCFAAMLSARRALDLSGVWLIQAALADFMRRGEHRQQLRAILPQYRARRDALIHTLAVALPVSASWTHPRGGFSCWVTLPPVVDTGALYYAAMQRGVAFTPGSVFYDDGEENSNIRLCFCHLDPESIKDSVYILGELVRTQVRSGVGTFRRAVTTNPLV